MSETIPDDLARDLFDAYTASTGGKTWDGRDVPPYDVIAQRTPHVARAWEAVAKRARERLARPVVDLRPSMLGTQLVPGDGFRAPGDNPGARVVRTGE
jgi:hypothetical protein